MRDVIYLDYKHIPLAMKHDNSRGLYWYELHTGGINKAYNVYNKLFGLDSDHALKVLCIEKGIIPEQRPDDYYINQIKDKNSVKAWVVMTRAEKIKLIDSLKEKFEENGVSIRKPSVDYVRIMNVVLYDKIYEGDIVRSYDYGYVDRPVIEIIEDMIDWFQGWDYGISEGGAPSNEDCAGWYEVIGNIHENPGLLEVKT